ncbi:MAG: hypothetical protein ISS57_18125 [Anaerolineales bacterium]|nr:hypothetical protein [Anaerolineales bacterium]
MFIQPATSERACGKRIAAGIYAETRLSNQGQPIESYIVDPPKPIDIEKWGLTARGARLVEVGGVWHIFDIVGREHYPHVADIVEEIRCKGASRRLAGNLDFSRLTPESRLVLIHARAVIENFDEYPQPPRVTCPRFEHLDRFEETCAGLWWHDIPEGDLTADEHGQYTRSIPGEVSYRATPRIEGLVLSGSTGLTVNSVEGPALSEVEGVVPQYHHGIFMRLPVTNLTVIAGRNVQEEKEAEKAYQAVNQSSLPIFMEEE